MTPQWQPYREPLRSTIIRTFMIAIIGGALLTRFGHVRFGWPLAALLMLWPSFGGHWVEVWFLNWLRPRLPAAPGLQAAARLAVWFVAGIGLSFATRLTAMALAGFRPVHWFAWWLGGLGFIGVELVAHLALLVRGLPSFYSGRAILP